MIVFFDVDGVDLGMREDNLFFFEIQFMLIRKKQGMIGPQGEIVETVLGLGTTSEIALQSPKT